MSTFHHSVVEDLEIPDRWILTFTCGAGTSIEWRPVSSFTGPPNVLGPNSQIVIGPGPPLKLRFKAIGTAASYVLTPDAVPSPPS